MDGIGFPLVPNTNTSSLTYPTDHSVADGAGDLLDAVICAVQGAWAATQPAYGLPANAPAHEGWIVSA